LYLKDCRQHKHIPPPSWNSLLTRSERSVILRRKRELNDRTPPGKRKRNLFALPGCAILLLASGCARQPPSQTSLSGKRLRVTLTFNAALDNPNYHYFFVINYDTSQGIGGNSAAPGPIPVIGPSNANQSFGNGFAASSDNGPGGFTDFVEFTQGNFNLYHVIGSTINRQFNPNGRPIVFTPPDPTDPRTARVISFDLDLSQIVFDASGNKLDPLQAATQARAIRYLQVNAIATNIVPTDVTQVIKQVDSFGDDTSSIGQTNFLRLDASQNGSIANGDQRVPNSTEPSGNDVISNVSLAGGGDERINLVDWRIDIVQQ